MKIKKYQKGKIIEGVAKTAKNVAENLKTTSKSDITKIVDETGKIRLRLPSHTVQKPREFVLEPQGNNQFRVHMRTWDGDHIPANLSTVDKNTLFNAVYNELPVGGEILFPQSGPGYYGTRGTVAGLQRLARDSRFTPTSKGVLQYIDKDGSVKTFEGTGFKKLQMSSNLLEKLKHKQGGILKAQGGAGKKAIKAISKIAENIKGTNKITDLDKIKNRVKITLSDPEKYWYVGHQTGSGNLDNISKYGLQTTNGLSGTAIPLSQDFTNTFAKGLTKKFHLSHEGSDGLVIMKFPKVKFPSSDLDDISIRLMDLGESKNFEVPPEYLSFIKKQQLENGGILKQEL